MISLNNIYENIIAEVIIGVISWVLSKFLPFLFKKEESLTKHKTFDMLNISILLTSISVLNLILSISFWKDKQELTILFTLLSIAFGIASFYIYNNQCPACKKFIGVKKKIDEKTFKEFTKKIPYQPMKVWKYSNGQIKKKEPFGNKKVRIEKWQTKQEFYECSNCKHKWDSGQKDVPIFIEKEVHQVINTGERDPNEPSF